jgi:hypothetical protein
MQTSFKNLKITQKNILKSVLTFSLFGIANSSFAQVDAGALQQNLESQLPLPSPLPLPKVEKKTPSSLEPEQTGEIRFTVNSFTLQGVNLLPEAKVQEALKPWVGKVANFDKLQEACDAVIAVYRENGFTVQAILPPQKIDGGNVTILVTEAKLSSVVVNTPGGPTRYSTKRVSDFITNANPIGDPLNLDNLQRSLILLKETPGVIITSQLEPGQNDAETALKVDLAESNILAGRGELNNYGSRTTGSNQAVAAINLYNPGGYGDQAGFNAIASQGSQYAQAAYSLPVGTDGLRLGLAATYLNYRNVSNYAYNGGFGNAWTTGASLAYPLIRSETTNANMSLAADVKDYSNKNISTNAVISAYTINNKSFGMSGNHYDGFGYGGTTSGAFTIVSGNLSISSSSAPGYGSQTPSSFAKLVFSGSRNQVLTEDGLTHINLNVSGQLANANLNSAEQFYLGGPYGIRAYPVAQSPGSQGGLASLELARRFPSLSNITVSTFFDYGAVQQYKNTYPGWQGQTNAGNTYSLKGAGLGLRWSEGGWNVNASIAWMVGKNPLYNQSGQAVNVDGTTTQPRGWISASYNF